MLQKAGDVYEILKNCEEKNLTPGYGKKQVELNFAGKDIFVISDLHIAGGKNIDGNYSGTENFFYDRSLKNFISYILKNKDRENGLLIINGDFIDFLRITGYPEEEEEFCTWKENLEYIGINKTVEELKKSISKKEIKYGLKTNDYKSVWKLSSASKGHSEVFEAIADWLSTKNTLIFVKGNHDLEIYWPAVRNFFRFIFAKIISEKTNTELIEVLYKNIFPNLLFIDESILIEKDFYIEHGHNFDKFATCIGDPLINKDELNIPFGSFFNRYLLNHIELVYPYLDNVRPRQDILALLLRERFFLGMRVLLQHVPFLVLIIPKKYYKYMFGRVLVIAIAVLLPLVYVLIKLWQLIEPSLSGVIDNNASSGIIGYLQKKGVSIISDLGLLFFSFIFARIVAYFQLDEPSTLFTFAKKKFDDIQKYRIITFGHTHNPAQVNYNGKWFFNTGTWIPIVEISSAEVRFDKTFTFLHLKKDASGKFQPENLMRWNDDAGRPEEAGHRRKEVDTLDSVVISRCLIYFKGCGVIWLRRHSVVIRLRLSFGGH